VAPAATGASFTAAALTALTARGRKAAPRSQDPVFRWLSKVLSKTDRSLGQVLDAGTGPDSLTWLARQRCESITAVTACDGMYATLEDEVMEYLDPSRDKVLVGNWKDETFLQKKSFDLVLADYLLGSVDFFAPYFQVGLLERLSHLTKPGGMLILVGKEPPEDLTSDATSQLVLDIECFRDAVITLGRQRPYREMPRRWCAQQLNKDFQLLKGRLFPRKLNEEKVLRNLDWAAEELENVQVPLREAMQKHLELLRSRLRETTDTVDGHVFGQDYALVLEKLGK